MSRLDVLYKAIPLAVQVRCECLLLFRACLSTGGFDGVLAMELECTRAAFALFLLGRSWKT